jgi:hypothetical protein
VPKQGEYIRSASQGSSLLAVRHRIVARRQDAVPERSSGALLVGKIAWLLWIAWDSHCKPTPPTVSSVAPLYDAPRGYESAAVESSRLACIVPMEPTMTRARTRLSATRTAPIRHLMRHTPSVGKTISAVEDVESLRTKVTLVRHFQTVSKSSIGANRSRSSSSLRRASSALCIASASRSSSRHW